MKRLMLLLLIICFVGCMAACGPNEVFLVKESYKPIYTEEGGLLLHTASPTPLPMVTGLKPQEVVLPTPAPTTAPTPTMSNPTMYTSYAHLVSYDPSTYIAAFDYFDMLQGAAAVDWLVANEGYSRDEAEAYVAGWGDSEFIERNLNPRLRMINLSTVPQLRLMHYPSGKAVVDVTSAEPRSVTIEEVNRVYTYASDLLLNSFFFRVVVNAACEVTEVRQVYWP